MGLYFEEKTLKNEGKLPFLTKFLKKIEDLSFAQYEMSVFDRKRTFMIKILIWP